MALAHARSGNAHEFRAIVKFAQRACAHITHSRAQAAGELMQHGCRGSFVGYLALDAFRHELERIPDILLEVPVGRAARHSLHGPHPTVGLVRSPLIQKYLAWRVETGLMDAIGPMLAGPPVISAYSNPGD